ncbi:sporulation integral membrane protein YtvI [Kingella potus]|uniref:Sporulation integral membrane protein YtvI n=1 Tax=Kingella potus TaxID=265175 RepID=A0A377QYF0_9NEIS|nr:AI-2E family transporter [Kingella potus]STR00263.1 sporulation integral membrane protein YtvI [Kingella potus]
MQTHPDIPAAKFRAASYILMGLSLAAVLYFHFLPLLLAVVLTYIFIAKTNGLILWTRRRLLPRNRVLQKILTAHNINLVSATLAIGMVCLAIFLLSLGAYHMVQGGHIGVMLGKLAAILADTKNSKELPAAILNLLPNNTAEIQARAVALINEYGAALTRISKNSITSFVYILIGIIIGAMLSFHRLNVRRSRRKMPPFKAELVRRIQNFETSFERVFIAQVKISLVDTLLTGLYLYLVLPLFGVELPFRMTVLAIAFVVGLIPVVGNLISNTVIIILGLGSSLYVAVASLVFLVVIHKLEYFLNAKIIGSEIESSAWELLVAMVVCERIFGIGGIIVAPVYYAYLKSELKQRGLI